MLAIRDFAESYKIKLAEKSFSFFVEFCFLLMSELREEFRKAWASVRIALWFTNPAVLFSTMLVWSSVYLGENVTPFNVDPKMETMSVALNLSKLESLLSCLSCTLFIAPTVLVEFDIDPVDSFDVDSFV